MTTAKLTALVRALRAEADQLRKAPRPRRSRRHPLSPDRGLPTVCLRHQRPGSSASFREGWSSRHH